MLNFSIIQAKTIFILILIFKKPHIKITKNKHNKTTKKKKSTFYFKVHSFIHSIKKTLTSIINSEIIYKNIPPFF